MKELLKSIYRFIGSRNFLILLTLTFTGYLFVEKTGIFRSVPASYREILHSVPSKGLSILLALNAVLGIIHLFIDKGLKRRTGFIFFHLSIIVIVMGLWVSAYTRFEGKTYVREWGSFTAFKSEYIPQTLYIAKRGRFPGIGFTVLKIFPETSDDIQRMKETKANVLYKSKATGKILEGQLRSSLPLITDWTFLRISDFGYTIKYRLLDLHEKELEGGYLDLKLFPPGAEGHFEMMFLGYVFYVQCYPDYFDDDGKPGSLSAYPRNPVFNLRIVRNKDIVFNGLLRPTEKVRFDNQILSLPEVKMWIEVSIVRDLGLPIVAIGIFLMIVGVALMLIRRRS